MQRKNNILLVDDDIDLREAMAWILRSNNFCVDEAVDGAMGLDLVRAHQYDLIISDLQMPNCDGIGFLKKVFKSILPHPPMIVISGGAQEKYSELQSLGVCNILAKPVTTETLIKHVREVLVGSEKFRSPAS